MPKFQLNKLVRDNLVQKSEDLGITVDYFKLQWQEEILALLNKIKEESWELGNETEPQKILWELVDVQQAINDLIKKMGIPVEEFIQKVEAKKIDKWWFEQWLYVKTMEMDDSNPRSDYYKQDPQRFPEVQ